jgi:hypothetical protein
MMLRGDALLAGNCLRHRLIWWSSLAIPFVFTHRLNDIVYWNKLFCVFIFWILSLSLSPDFRHYLFSILNLCGHTPSLAKKRTIFSISRMHCPERQTDNKRQNHLFAIFYHTFKRLITFLTSFSPLLYITIDYCTEYHTSILNISYAFISRSL